MDTYTGAADIYDGKQHLLSVHTDVAWQEDRWWGVLIAEPAIVNLVGRDLTLRIADHPGAALVFHKLATQSDSGQWTVYFDGSGPAPFWAARAQAELIQELRRRRPQAAAAGLRLPRFDVPDSVADEIREILRERDGLSENEIEALVGS